MTEPTIQIDPSLTIPFVDQWLGTWFIEPERGRALHSAIRQLNIGVHLDAQASAHGSHGSHTPHRIVVKERDALAQNPDGQPVAIDWEQVPRSRGAYGYRVIDGVAVLELNGSLMKHEASATESTSTVMMRRSVRKLMTDSQVKAVLFQIDSPGGTVSGIYELATDIAALAKIKPVHAHAANLCASAAYLLASQMRSISATASSLVGSMGTYGVVYDLSEMAAQQGVKVHLLKGRINGKDALMKGAGTPGTAISAEQLARMQEGVDDLNQQFYDAVLAGPRKPKAAAVEGWFADAGVWVAAKAKQMGLIDRVESFDDMLARVSGEAKNAARDTTPSTTNKPSDDGTNTGRRSETAAGAAAGGDDALHSISMTAGGQTISICASSAAAALTLFNGLNQNNQDNQTGGTSAGESKAEDVAGASPTAGSEAEAPLSQEADMSQQQQGATAPATAATPPASAPATSEQTVANPASMAELKAACPGASSDFLVLQAESGATIAQATVAFIGWQSAQITARDEQIVKLQAATPAVTEQAKKPGVPAIASAAAENPGETAVFAAGDYKAQAKHEWESNFEDCRAAFISERAYTGSRVAELQGRVKTYRK
jgi:signal peptide peptidase SppA